MRNAQPFVHHRSRTQPRQSAAMGSAPAIPQAFRSTATILRPLIARLGLVSAIIAHGLIIRNAIAQNDMALDDTATLETLVVTASRVAQTADESLAPVSVITREDIDRLQPASLTDLLRTQAGITIVNQGGCGKLSTLFMRGAESDQVLILIDGVKAGSNTSGLFRFEFFPLEMIERIEVVRGAKGSLYGSDAIGGVVQIFTRDIAGESAKSRVRVSAGSRGSVGAGVNLSLAGERGWIGIAGSSDREDGFDANVNTAAENEPDKDGCENNALALRGGYEIGGGYELGASVMYNDGESEFDGSFQDRTKIERLSGTLSIEGHNLQIRIGHREEDDDSFKGERFTGEFISRRNEIGAQYTAETENHGDIVYGFDYRRDSVDTTTAYTVDNRDNKALYLQWLGDRENLDWQATYRWDDNEQFGGVGTGNVGAGWQLSDDMRLTASWGTAFRAPTFNDLYYPGYANPDLDPEESEAFNIGLAGDIDTLSWSANYFHRSVDRLIASSAANDYIPQNIEKAGIQGLELTLDGNLSETVFAAALTLIDARDLERDRRLPRRPRNSFRLDIDRQLTSHLGIGGTWRLEGERHEYPFGGGTTVLGGFGTLDLRASYSPAKRWEIAAKIENATDKKYMTAENYNQPGFGLFMTLRYLP
ncbi:TonB-dependent receptor domain-containing protein [Thioalkalivibrio sp. HK1]|uniref:TonB-dependent receptor domain-containing protein n=1 Tax=Thioalkalivibrio sp. HK1 TaxID=1469245 RepID=UPI0012DC45D2|nr:TonB-dependent receptor [Thioalkalivibrio sp. HK1]